MRTARLIFALCILQPLQATIFESYNSVRLSIGPLWCKYLFAQTFQLNPAFLSGFNVILPSADLAESPYQMLAYIEGCIKCTPYKQFNLAFSAGGGLFKDQGASFNLPIPARVHPSSELLATFLPAQFDVSTAILDASLGYRFFNHDQTTAFNPLVGYLFNKAHPVVFMYSADATYDFKNTWKGPYIGFELLQKIYDCLALEFFYKWSIAQAKTVTNVSVPPNLTDSPTLLVANATHSTVTVGAWGNYAQIAGWYFQDCWRLGVRFGYLQFKNRSNKKICFGPFNTFGTASNFGGALYGSTLTRLVWQQLILSVSFECQF